MKHIPILVAVGLGSILGSPALAEPAQPKAWFDEPPSRVTRDAGTTPPGLDERVASKQLALARAEQRIAETRADWNHATLHWFGWPAGPAAERHREAVVNRDQLQLELFRAQDLAAAVGGWVIVPGRSARTRRTRTGLRTAPS